MTNTNGQSFVHLEERLGALRKEPATLNSLPVKQSDPDAAPLDYSEGCLLIDLGKRNLDEACPDRQAERISLAIEVIQMGLDKLKEWAKAKGVPVAELK